MHRSEEKDNMTEVYGLPPVKIIYAIECETFAEHLVSLACLGSITQGSATGTSVELAENSFQTSVHSSFCLYTVDVYCTE